MKPVEPEVVIKRFTIHCCLFVACKTTSSEIASKILWILESGIEQLIHFGLRGRSVR